MTAHIDQLKNQLRQLDELAQTGALSEEQHTAAKEKLERQLIEAIMAAGPGELTLTSAAASKAAAPAQAEAPAAPASRKLVWGMVAFVAAVGVGGYLLLGNPAAMQVAPQGTEAAAGGASSPHAMGMDQIAGMAESLAAKLKTDPKNAEGWAMLARSYAVLGRFEEAVPAYKKVIELRQDDAQIYADYADALAATQGRKLDGEPTKLIAKSLSIDPNNFKALSLSGTIAYEKQDFKSAASLWERAIKTAPADNIELGKQMRAALDDAREKAGLPPLPAAVSLAPPAADAGAPPAPAATGPGAEVAGTVSLSKDLAGKVSPDDTVFIFAKAANGPKMPLAILRKQVKDLPATFTLTDAMAMSPQMKLSGFPSVVVGARVSKSGQAMPQPGDLQGNSAEVKLGAKDIKVEIADTVR